MLENNFQNKIVRAVNDRDELINKKKQTKDMPKRNKLGSPVGNSTTGGLKRSDTLR